MPTPRPRLERAEAAALGVVALWWAWALVVSLLNGRQPPLAGTFFVAPLVLVLGFLLGRLAARRRPGLLVEVALFVPLVALLPGVPVQLAPGPPPLGYANANTAAAIQVMVLFALAALDRARDRWDRGLLAVGVAVAAWAVVHHGSIAGMVTAVPVLVAVVLMLVRPARGRRWALALGGGSLLAAVGAFLWLATRPTWPAAVLRALDPVRKVMWQKALELWAARPVTGGGPGSYVEVNPYGQDTDTMAAHSALLQTGSELGLVGVVALALAVAAGYALACRGRPAHAVLGIAAWTALWIHSLVDHLFDYPGLALLAGAVLGWSEAVRTAPRPPGSGPTPKAAAAPTPGDAS